MKAAGFRAEALLKFRPRHHRRLLCVFPRYSKSFGTFEYAFPLMGPVKGFMPPQGILVVASLLPREWEVVFVDENIRPATPQEFEQADAVLVSGMHIQREQMIDIQRRARACGKLSVLGGPSVSAAPQQYPDFDVLHCGEAGDATLRLFELIDESCERLASQIILRTEERLPMTLMPMPDYRHIKVTQYLLTSISYSSGCPFRCEFCDIPYLYGRRPRRKEPEQVIRELETLAQGGTPSVYFVDDNFIADPKAALELLPHLVRWQERWDYQIRLACEATLNIVQYPKILSLMREAGFTNIFCGVETPEPKALLGMGKTQNLRTPILEAIRTLNQYGLEVAAGIILGLDTDTDQTADAIIDFIDATQIPIATVNLVHALPNTPLHDRLAKDGRLRDEPGRESNVEFLRPYEQVVRDWSRVIETVYDPERLYKRYASQAEQTYPNRMKPRQPLRQLTWSNVQRASGILGRMVWRLGVHADYRPQFWKMFWRELKRGRIENIFQVAMVAHHLITYGRECVEGAYQASNYSVRRVERKHAA